MKFHPGETYLERRKENIKKALTLENNIDGYVSINYERCKYKIFIFNDFPLYKM